MNAVQQRIRNAKVRRGNDSGGDSNSSHNGSPTGKVSPPKELKRCVSQESVVKSDAKDAQQQTRGYLLSRILMKRTPSQQSIRPDENRRSSLLTDSSSSGRKTIDRSDSHDSNDFIKLSKLMHQQEWETVYINLFDDQNDELKPRHSLSSMVHFGGEHGVTVLHALCRYQPPLDLVADAVEVWPFLVSQRDNMMRHTPLHVACQFGSRSDVVKFLLQNYTEAALLPDVHGRLPLHLACRPIRFLGDGSEVDNGNGKDFEEDLWIHAGSAVIGALCKHSPDSTNVEDVNSCNALELALDRGLSHKICQLLLDTSNQVWKVKKEKGILEDESLHSVRSETISSFHNLRNSFENAENFEVVTMPGAFSHSAAQEHLRQAKTRSGRAPSSALAEEFSRSMPLPLYNYDDDDDELDYRFGDKRLTQSMNLPLQNLPPYEEMLKKYITHLEQKQNGMIPSSEFGSFYKGDWTSFSEGHVRNVRRRGSQLSPNFVLDTIINASETKTRDLNCAPVQKEDELVPQAHGDTQSQEHSQGSIRRRRGSQVGMPVSEVLKDKRSCNDTLVSALERVKIAEARSVETAKSSPRRIQGNVPLSLDSSWHSSNGSYASRNLLMQFQANRPCSTLDRSFHSGSSRNFGAKPNPYANLLEKERNGDIKEEVRRDPKDARLASLKRSSIGRAA